ncbi:hypothetical protein FA13DRAFT_1815944, partial [Coprinellus micaceus]
MSIVPASPKAGPSITQILKQLCRALNPVKAGRIRISVPRSPDVTHTSAHRRTLQSSISALNIAFSIAETIPVVGPPLKGALEALYKILGEVEQRFQNAEAAERLVQRLASLGRRLSHLEDPESFLEDLTEPGIRYQAIAQALADFTNEINAYLLDYLTVTQIELVARTRVADVESISTQCVTVVDPFGSPQPILRMDVGNIEIVAAIILRRYDFNPYLRKALEEFVARGLYDLTIHDGHRIQPLMDSSVASGVTVVMSVMMGNAWILDNLSCPLCNKPLLDKGEGSDHRGGLPCGRSNSRVDLSDRLVVSRGWTSPFPSTYSLFRNIYYQCPIPVADCTAGERFGRAACQRTARVGFSSHSSHMLHSLALHSLDDTPVLPRFLRSAACTFTPQYAAH